METFEHLVIDADDLVEALDSDYEEAVWLLDLETGAIVSAQDDELDGEPVEEPWEDSGRYLQVGCRDSSQGFAFMEDFVDELPEGEAARALGRALRLPRPFRAFRTTLEDFPALRERWFKYEHDRMLVCAQAWIEDHVPGARLVVAKG